MASWLLSIASELLKYPAKTLDTMRAWVQQYEKYNIPRDGIFCHFQAGLEVGTRKRGTGYAAPGDWHLLK